MIRVMIADDEKFEREYLTKFISEKYGRVLKLVFAAKDGAELVSKALELNPEIILMDIRMPRLDGLEAAGQLKRKLPNTAMVILSAYGQFSYAKQAIKLGVKDFLVKPYLDEELEETLNRLIALMDMDEDISEKEKSGDMEILYGDADRDIVWPMAFQIRGSSILKKDLQLFGIRSGSFKCISFYHDSILKMGSGGCEVIRSFFRQASDHVLVSSIFKQMVLYIFSDEELAYSELNTAIRKTREYLTDFDQNPVLCGVSGTYETVEQAGMAFSEAEKYVEDYALPESQGSFKEMLSDIEELCKAEDRMRFGILSKNREESMKNRDRIIKIFRKYEPDGSMMLRDSWHLIMSEIRKMNYHSEKRIPTETALMIQSLFSEGAPKDAEAIFEKALSIIDRISEDKVFSGNAMIVRKAKEFLNEHYKEQIGLQTVADELEVSSGYLSKSFKAQEGKSFTEYLTEIRIEHSMQLMRETGMSITEISYEVGFQDPGYFGKCFKKTEKISPSEYVALLKT